eukprot:10583573-Karenia_brevis.AAC.1
MDRPPLLPHSKCLLVALHRYILNIIQENRFIDPKILLEIVTNHAKKDKYFDKNPLQAFLHAMADATTSHMYVRPWTTPEGEQTGKGGSQEGIAVDNEVKEFGHNEKRKGRVEENSDSDSSKEDERKKVKKRRRQNLREASSPREGIGVENRTKLGDTVPTPTISNKVVKSSEKCTRHCSITM